MPICPRKTCPASSPTAPGQPHSIPICRCLYQRYGIPVLQNYGATEFAGGIAGWTLDDFKAHWNAKRGSVGRVNQGIDARVVDPEAGVDLPLGEIGLLELRGGNAASPGEWTRTNDLAMLDADNFLWIKGRYDGAIIRGGFKISPDDVVKALEQHPAVGRLPSPGSTMPGSVRCRLRPMCSSAGRLRRRIEDLKAFLKGC